MSPRTISACISLVLTGACTIADRTNEDPGFRYAAGRVPIYVGDDFEGDQASIGGDGAEWLDPWLSGTVPGQHLVQTRFDRNFNGRIGIDRAGEANRWFRRFADRNGDLRLTDREISWGLVTIDRSLRRND